MNGEQQAETAGFYQATYRDGLRQSTAHCFLNSVENREELTVRTGAFVSHLLFSGKRVSGAEVKREGSTKYQEHAKRGVILCAGAINSPTILLRSGIGPKRELLELGIQAVVDLRVLEKVSTITLTQLSCMGVRRSCRVNNRCPIAEG